MARNGSRKRASFGVLFWIAAILLVVVLLMYNLPAIRSVLDSTDFVEVVFEERSEDTGESPVSTPDEPMDDPQEIEIPVVPPDQTETADEPVEPEPSDVEDGDGIPSPQASPDTEIVLAPPAREEETGPERSIRRTLYYIRVSGDGRILAEAVDRTIRYESSPLTRTMEALIAGPSSDDLNRGLLSLIPSDAQLLSARVASGVAFLNFNEAFRFNPMGLEGLLAQLQQVVLTATQFSTVDAVQILIDGQIVPYLGGDGVYVGEPLYASDVRG